MEITDAVPEKGRQKLAELRLILLNLHKALLDSERTAYEIGHGAIGSPAAFLHLLINDPSFQWHANRQADSALHALGTLAAYAIADEHLKAEAVADVAVVNYLIVGL